MKSIFKIFGILMILAVVSLSGCIGEDVTVDDELDVVIVDDVVEETVGEPVADEIDDVVEVVESVEEADDTIVAGEPMVIDITESSERHLVAGVDGKPGSYKRPAPAIVIVEDPVDPEADGGDEED